MPANASGLPNIEQQAPRKECHPKERPVRHLHQEDLARRWNISCRTLERWRWLDQGPPYLKVGARVVYRLADIEAYEAAHMRSGGSARTAS